MGENIPRDFKDLPRLLMLRSWSFFTLATKGSTCVRCSPPRTAHGLPRVRSRVSVTVHARWTTPSTSGQNFLHLIIVSEREISRVRGSYLHLVQEDCRVDNTLHFGGIVSCNCPVVFTLHFRRSKLVHSRRGRAAPPGGQPRQ